MGGGVVWRSGCGVTGVARSRRSTPHLTSPLEGGRDELGKGWWVPACAGMTEWGARSCLRRNDGMGAPFLPAQE